MARPEDRFGGAWEIPASGVEERSDEAPYGTVIVSDRPTCGRGCRFRAVGLAAAPAGFRQAERARVSRWSRARSRAASACFLETEGKLSRKRSIVSPAARWSKSEAAGTRVPRKTGVPLEMSG